LLKYCAANCSSVLWANEAKPAIKDKNNNNCERIVAKIDKQTKAVRKQGHFSEIILCYLNHCK
jgi:hypothetical protein